jgi:hypothetical protein
MSRSKCSRTSLRTLPCLHLISYEVPRYHAPTRRAESSANVVGTWLNLDLAHRLYQLVYTHSTPIHRHRHRHRHSHAPSGCPALCLSQAPHTNRRTHTNWRAPHQHHRHSARPRPSPRSPTRREPELVYRRCPRPRCVDSSKHPSKMLTHCRRPLRCRRLALLAPLCLPRRIPTPLHPTRHAGRPQWQGREYSVDSLLPRALPPRPRRHPLPLPEDIRYESHYRASLDKGAHLLHRHSPARRPGRLARCAAPSASCVDRSYPFSQAYIQC